MHNGSIDQFSFCNTHAKQIPAQPQTSYKAIKDNLQYKTKEILLYTNCTQKAKPMHKQENLQSVQDTEAPKKGKKHADINEEKMKNNKNNAYKINIALDFHIILLHIDLQAHKL